MSMFVNLLEPRPRYEDEMLRIHCYATVTERVEWTIWKQSNIDCLSGFATCLATDLLTPRDQLMQALVSGLRRGGAPQSATLPDGGSHLCRMYETVEVEGGQVDVITRTNAEQCGRNYDIFIYGRDPKKIEAVIKNAIHGIISEHKEIEIPTMTLNGRKTGKLTGTDCREMLSAEFSKHEDPKILLIILEEFTSDMFSSFKGSGFVDAKRCKGIPIIIICSSTDYWGTKLGSTIWREFTYNVFVPNRVDETPWIPEREEETGGNQDMVVHKSGSTEVAHVVAGEVLYATVQKVIRESVQGKENDEPKECTTISTAENNQLRGQYAELQLQPMGRGGWKTTPNSIPSSVVNDEGVTDSAYSTIQSVVKPEPSPKPIVMQPRKMSESASVFGGQPDVQVQWNKSKPDFVNLQRVDVNMGNSSGTDDSKLMKDEFPIQESLCDRIANCIVIGYVCLLD